MEVVAQFWLTGFKAQLQYVINFVKMQGKQIFHHRHANVLTRQCFSKNQDLGAVTPRTNSDKSQGMVLER